LNLPGFKHIKDRQLAFGIVLILFLVSIFIRLPSLNRPISKHYEFNSAVVLINIISWREAGGGSRFHFTPVLNFQHPGDKLPPNNLNIDKDGNSVYLSFGPGWYVIPYFFYQLFHLPAIPIYLEILNLLFHLAAVILFFYLMEFLLPSGQVRKYFMVTAGCCFMIFSPGMLWFLGNGYVNTGIMLPIVLAVLLLLLPMLQNTSRITAGRLSALFLLIILLLYIDWYILFLCFLSLLVALLKWRKYNQYGPLLLVLLLSIVTGTALIFFQFASHMGWQAVIDYWLSRSSERSLNLAGSTIFTRFSYLLIYFLTSYLPLLLLFLVCFLYSWRRKILSGWSKREIFFLKLFGASLVFYNLVLFNWSTDHEFAVIPWGILLSFVAARLLGSLKNRRMAGFAVALFMVCAISLYYWINRPGPVSRDGIPYESFKTMGESLKGIPPDYTICIQLEQNPMVEYYAGRNLLRAPDSLSVKKLLNELGIKKAVWVSHNAYQVENIRIIQ
jgi:hypothetical protein